MYILVKRQWEAVLSPTIFYERGYRFYFFSREEDRIHIHVISGDGEAKFWLNPRIEVSKSWGYSEKQLNTIKKIIEAHYDDISRAWREIFSC